MDKKNQPSVTHGINLSFYAFTEKNLGIGLLLESIRCMFPRDAVEKMKKYGITGGGQHQKHYSDNATLHLELAHNSSTL